MAFKKYDWKNFSFDTLIDTVSKYNGNDKTIAKLYKAYNVANSYHQGQLRKSGEPYISHPVAVANFLAIMKCDTDTICAGLLHDTIEDTNLTKEDVKRLFGKDVSEIVEGVTKINEMDNLTRDELKIANTKKLIDSLLYDPRIIIVKLADRLHNMLTICYKTPAKQVSKALETISIYAPLANRLGMYRIQKELEDACFRCIEPFLYNEIHAKRELLKIENTPMLDEMLSKMEKVVTDNIKVIGHLDSSLFEGLEGEDLQKRKEELTKQVFFKGMNESRRRIKHLYGIYDALTKIDNNNDNENISKRVHELIQNEENFERIHDLRVIKLIFKDEDACFSALRFLHKEFNHVDKYLKDYIDNPKPNLYQSLHSTVVYNGKYVQFQLRTLEQEYRNTFGLAWELYKFEGKNTRKKILDEFKQYPEYNALKNILKNDDTDLNTYKESIDNDILYPKEIIVVNKDNGDNIALREHATVHDFAYQIGGKLGDHLLSVTLNDERISLRFVNGLIDESYYPFDIELKSGDEISCVFSTRVNTPRRKIESKKEIKKGKTLTLKKDN